MRIKRVTFFASLFLSSWQPQPPPQLHRWVSQPGERLPSTLLWCLLTSMFSSGSCVSSFSPLCSGACWPPCSPLVPVYLHVFHSPLVPVYLHVLWCLLTSSPLVPVDLHVLQCSLKLFNVTWCPLRASHCSAMSSGWPQMFCDVPWCSTMFLNIL